MDSYVTLCFAGTDCWPDEGFTNPHGSNGSDPALYGPVGYIPVRIYGKLSPDSRSVVIPGVGAAYARYKHRLWARSSDNEDRAVPLGLQNAVDPFLGHGMEHLADHAVAKVVGIPSDGRKKPDLAAWSAPEVHANLKLTQSLIGAHLAPIQGQSRSGKLPLLFSHTMLEVLNSSHHARGSEFGPITRINMIGHGRGAVEAIMCSHDLAVLFPNAEVNIFAISPVPGIGVWSEEEVSLGSTVKNYVGVYALDEVSNGFTAVVPKPIDKNQRIDPLAPLQTAEPWECPNYHLVYAPGRHSTVSGNCTADGGREPPEKASDEATAVGLLVDMLARSCLSRWGVLISHFHLEPLEEMRKFIDSKASFYREMRNYTYKSGSSPLHLREAAVSSSSGGNTSAWKYLEDVIGAQPLVPRSRFKNIHSRAPGQCKWWKLQEVPDVCFLHRDSDEYAQELDKCWIGK